MDQHASTDAELVAQTLAGDREAFGQLYDRHARLARAVTAGVSGDWSAVSDMVQESFMRAYRRLPTLRDPDRFGPWITGIARQVARERRRTLRRDRHEFRGSTPENASLDAVASDRDQLALVMQGLAGLPEQERLAIHAFFLEERDARHGAELLGVSRSGFYGLLQRGLARLASWAAADRDAQPQARERAE